MNKCVHEGKLERFYAFVSSQLRVNGTRQKTNTQIQHQCKIPLQKRSIKHDFRQKYSDEDKAS